ncbi:MAG: hypothetical protein HY913_13825 [Desulfomonile tiedjei]|nr:hypothetical protein [Desulfomonile tiedjei]
MDANVIIGGTILVMAIVGAAFVVSIIAATAWSLTHKSSPEISRHGSEALPGELSTEQGGLKAGQCYWDCMNGFHWAADWENQCASACGMAEKPGVA